MLYNNGQGQQRLYLHSLRTAKGTIMLSKNGQICTVVFFSPFFNGKMIKVFRPYLCIDSIIYRRFYCFLNICAANHSNVHYDIFYSIYQVYTSCLIFNCSSTDQSTDENCIPLHKFPTVLRRIWRIRLPLLLCRNCRSS